MGLHYINGDLVGDAEVAAATPEALVYAPKADGGLRLVAVEYVVFAEAWDAANDAPPSLFGEEFHFTDAPNRYEIPAFYALHAWIWKDNPSGVFADFNPNVTCDPMPDTATGLLTAEAQTPSAGLGLTLLVGGLGLALGLGLRRRSIRSVPPTPQHGPAVPR